MRIKVLYAIMCVFLLSSCAVSSFSNRTTSRSLYQHGHFKKPTGFKMSNSKMEHKEKFQAGNSSLIFSEELTLIQDSIVPKINQQELPSTVAKRQNSYVKERPLINNYKRVLISERDTSSNTKLVKRAHTISIIGTSFAHAIPIFYGIGLSGIFGITTFPAIGILLLAIGLSLAVAALILNLIAIRYLNRIEERKKIYYVLVIISLVFAFIAIIGALLGVFALMVIALFAI